MTRLHYPNKVTGTCWPPQIPFSCKICSFFQSFSLFILASFTRSSFYLDTMKRVQRVWKPRSRCLSRHWLADSCAPELREPFGYSDVGQEHRLPLLVSRLTALLRGLVETSLEPKAWWFWVWVCGAPHPGLHTFLSLFCTWKSPSAGSLSSATLHGLAALLLTAVLAFLSPVWDYNRVL